MEEVNEHMDSREIPDKNDEIDLIEVAKIFRAEKKLIVKVTVIFLLLGLIIAFGSKVEYEASCKLMPESQESINSSLGGLGGLAGLAGINLDMGSDKGTLTPELYPQIAQSVPFLLKVWKEPISFEKEDTTTSSYIYFKEIENSSFLGLIKKYTIGLPFQIKTLLSQSDNETSTNQDFGKIIRLSKKDTKLLENYRKRITVNVDTKTGILTLKSEMPDALAAAELAQLSIDLLTNYITEYKVSKAKENYVFIKARFDEAKAKFEKTQEKLAFFNDRNRNVVTAVAQSESQRLQNEYNLAFELYKGLAAQLEQANIKVKEETPVFTVLEPVQLPTEKSSPKRMIIMIISLIIGLVAGSGIMFGKKIYTNIKAKI